MAFNPIEENFLNTDDTRGEHPSHHNDLAERLNAISAAFGEGTVGLPDGGIASNVLRVAAKKALGWSGTRMVTPGGRRGLVQTLVAKNPARWDWRVPKGEVYPSSRRRVNPSDPESEWLDSADFGAFQGWWIVDSVDPIGNDQWGENGDLWMVYKTSDDAS
jgi:hypothetical protein